MRTTKQRGMIPPEGMADEMNETVRSGECSSEGEVIRDGVRPSLAGNRAVENWLVRQAGPAHDALKADSSRAVTAGALRARLAAEYAKAR